MAENPQWASDPREDEDDLDLLTYTEAGIRLAEEIARVRERIDTAAELGDPADDLMLRLDALLAAQDRNSRPAIDDTTFEEFFGYPGTPSP